MPVWELEPVDPNHRNWKASVYKGRVVVRAATEKRAREIAKLAYAIAVERVPGTETVYVPWGLEEIVRCRRVEDGYPEDGPEAILDPSEHDQNWRQGT